MAGVNKTITLGRVGQDPEINYTPSGMAVCKFTLATSKKKKSGEEITSWHRCTAFDKRAEIIGQYVKKGDQFYVEGELSYGQYEKDGIKRYTTDIIVNSFSFIGGGKQGSQPQDRPQQNNQGPQQGTQQNYGQGQGHVNQGYSSPNNQMPPDDDIPF